MPSMRTALQHGVCSVAKGAAILDVTAGLLRSKLACSCFQLMWGGMGRTHLIVLAYTQHCSAMQFRYVAACMVRPPEADAAGRCTCLTALLAADQRAGGRQMPQLLPLRMLMLLSGQRRLVLLLLLLLLSLLNACADI